MLHEIAKTILEFFKLAPRYLIALGAAAAFLLFSSEQTLKRLGLVEFIQNNRAILGVTLVGSVALFGIWVVASIINAIRRWWHKRKFYRDIFSASTVSPKTRSRFFAITSPPIAARTRSALMMASCRDL